MNETLKGYLLTGCVVLLGVLALQGLVFKPTPVVVQTSSQGQETLGGLIHNTQESFDAGIAVNGTQIIGSSGQLSTNSLTLGSGTAIDKHVRATTSLDPSSIAANGATTTVVTVTGASSGDHCLVNATAGDLLSTTSTAVLACRAGTNNATVYYYNTSSTAAFDAGASTLSVQVWSY